MNPQSDQNIVSAEPKNWYIAIVGTNTEKASAERLIKLGYEAYAATQKTLRIWSNGRKAIIDRVVIRGLVFIKTSEEERRNIVNFPFILRFMVNKAGTPLPGTAVSPPAIIPDVQISALKLALSQKDTPVDVSENFRRGDKVRVIAGPLKGLEGEVSGRGAQSRLILRIDYIGQASLAIPPKLLLKIP